MQVAGWEAPGEADLMSMFDTQAEKSIAIANAVGLDREIEIVAIATVGVVDRVLARAVNESVPGARAHVHVNVSVHGHAIENALAALVRKIAAIAVAIEKGIEGAKSRVMNGVRLGLKTSPKMEESTSDKKNSAIQDLMLTSRLSKTKTINPSVQTVLGIESGSINCIAVNKSPSPPLLSIHS